MLARPSKRHSSFYEIKRERDADYSKIRRDGSEEGDERKKLRIWK
jgi:hypothetical protein